VANTCKQAIVTCGGERALADVVFRNEESATGWLTGVLGAVGEQGLESLLDKWSDVHDEGGADIGVQRGVEDLVGAMRRPGEIDLCQSAGEASLVAKGGGRVVVGMTALP